LAIIQPSFGGLFNQFKRILDPQLYSMSHPMFGLTGISGSTDSLQKFRGSLRGDMVGADARKQSMINRAFRDSDGAYQSFHHAQGNIKRTAASVKNDFVESGDSGARKSAAFSSQFDQTFTKPVSNSHAAVQKQQRAAFAYAQDLAHSLPVALERISDSSGHADLWDQGMLEAKLDRIETMSTEHVRLLRKVAGAMPPGATGGDYPVDDGAKSRSGHELSQLANRQSNRNASLQGCLPVYTAQLPVLEHIDAVALQLHRCVIEMRQRIDELNKMHASVSDDVHRREKNAPSFSLHFPTQPQMERQSPSSASRLRISQPNSAQLRGSPLANRIKSVHPAAAAARPGIALWQCVPQLHPCFVAVADGDWSLLLTVEQVKKADITSKYVTLVNWHMFLRHCKAYKKLGFSQSASKQAFDMALLSEGRDSEFRVNFFGFCQVRCSIKS
jgi:hypothetical protein